jgi:hypothetical protein
MSITRESKNLENLVEDYLKRNKIEYKREEQLISKFRPDFLLNPNIILECKFIDDSRQKDPSWERNAMAQASLISQLLSEVYPDKNFKHILVLSRKSGSCSPSNLLYGNIIFDLFIPFEYLGYLTNYINKTMLKEEIFFNILDDAFIKFWKKSRAGQFPTNIYHFLLCVENGSYNNVTDFIKNEGYGPSAQISIYNYLRVLNTLNIITEYKNGRYKHISLANKKWRYFVYLDTFSKGQFTRINVDYAKDLWSRISRLFNI